MYSRLYLYNEWFRDAVMNNYSKVNYASIMTGIDFLDYDIFNKEWKLE